MAVRITAAAMSVGGVSLTLAATTGMVMASARSTSTAIDSCGYPNSSSARAATVFNENTLTRAVQVVGSGTSARVVVFSNDENGVLLGVGSATHFSGSLHVQNPSLGDTAATDPSGRPLHPALFVTDITSNASSNVGDWQQGGAPVRFLSDVFGTWATGQMTAGGFQRDTLPAKNSWSLGAGSDTPSAGFSALGNEGYGTEFSWNVSALGLQPGHTYRFQVMTHDGDQNKSGGDVGEACANLTIPGLPATPAVTVDKTNNASGTGFSKTSTAPNAGASVPFRVVVKNTSQEQERVTEVTDTYGGQTITPDCRDASGTALLGHTLLVGETFTCTFTLAHYAPASGSSLQDTVMVKVTDANGRTDSDTSSSTVNTPSSPDPSVTVDKTNNAAGTGFAAATTAPFQGASVPFRLVVTNTSQEQERVTAVTDSYSGQSITPDCRDAGGTALLGHTLAVGETFTCTFTLQNYAPAAGTSLQDTVNLTVTDANGRTASDTATSTVSTPGSNVVSQTISGSILLCDTGGNRTTTPVNGGSLQALSGGTAVVSSANQLPPASVPSGTYTLTANGPLGYQFVACGVSGVNIASPTLASQPVTVPSGGSAAGVFYVSRIPITATIDKTNNAAGTGYGKVELAGTPNQDVPFRAIITNTSPVPVVITSLSDAWPGQAAFTPTCAQSVVGAVLAANGGTVTCDFTITKYSPPAGQWLVDTVTATLSQLDVQSSSTVASNSTTVTNTSTVGTTQVLGEQVSPPTTQGLVTVTQPPTQVLGEQLAFTGVPGWVWQALESGLAMMSVGFFVLWLTRPRELDGLTGTA
ncbi:MAG TPA: hypothetical protein VFH50_05250 [Acidimicrobiales bacterium]|nr:hypothetical protein [Acidimicrobiales bacterium]